MCINGVVTESKYIKLGSKLQILGAGNLKYHRLVHLEQFEIAFTSYKCKNIRRTK
jgi:hypothetical protein